MAADIQNQFHNENDQEKALDLGSTYPFLEGLERVVGTPQVCIDLIARALHT